MTEEQAGEMLLLLNDVLTGLSALQEIGFLVAGAVIGGVAFLAFIAGGAR